MRRRHRLRGCFECGKVEVVDADLGCHELVEERAEQGRQQFGQSLVCLSLSVDSGQGFHNLALLIQSRKRYEDALHGANVEVLLRETAQQCPASQIAFISSCGT